jgi:thiosulfate dehydrogenase
MKRFSQGAFLLGFLFAFPFLAASGYLYLRYGHPPVATADTPFPFEEQIVQIPLDARIDRQLSPTPFQPSAGDLIAGAHLYTDHCAMCHGTPTHDAAIAQGMFPPPPALWKKKDTHGTIGVSDNKPGAIYWKVANGIRLTGMPAFEHILNQTEMWQVSLLLKRAGLPLPAPITAILEETRRARAEETGNGKERR